MKPRRRLRAPDATRQRLLLAAFEEIYRQGFQGASLDTILARAGVTKGALYHHFRDKTDLGYAVVEEVVHGFLLDRWLSVLEDPNADPLSALGQSYRDRAADISDDEVTFGCPLNNLAQEMSPLDEGFRQRIEATFDAWRRRISAALARGQKRGTVRRDIDPRTAASFLVAATEGSYSLAKSSGRRAMLRTSFRTLADFVESLRPGAAFVPGAAHRPAGRAVV